MVIIKYCILVKLSKITAKMMRKIFDDYLKVLPLQNNNK